MLQKLETLKGKFWTGLNELVEEIEQLGFWVEEQTEQYVTVYTDDEDYEDTEWVLHLITAGSTIAVNDIEEIN